MRKTISPSRTYVAMCNKMNFDGYYFRKFVLPGEYENNSARASWYFFNVLNGFVCIEGCIPYEDYLDISEQE